ARLLRRGTRARVAARLRTGRVPPGHGRPGDGRVPPAVPHGGDHPRDRELTRARRRPGAGPRAGTGRDDPRVPLGPRRQGRDDRRTLVRLPRRDGRRRGMSTATNTGSGTGGVLAAAAAQDRAAFIGYLPVGYPDVPGSLDAVRALADGGADIIEIG